MTTKVEQYNSNPVCGTFPWGFYAEEGIGIDFAKAKRLGAKFAILRAADCDQLTQYGSPYDPSNYVDRAFHSNLQKAYDNGLVKGALYRLGVVPNVHAVDWKTPGAGMQWKSLWYAIGGRKVDFIVISLPRKDNTDTNMNEYLLQFIGVINTMYEQMNIPPLPIVIATTKSVWEYGSRAIENTIGQPDSKYPVFILADPENPAEDKFKPSATPGNLNTSNMMIWMQGYFNDSFVTENTSMFLRWWGSEADMLEKFGTPDNYDYIPGGDTPDPGDDDPGDTNNDGDDTNNGGDTPIVDGNLIAKLDEIEQAIREAYRI